MAARRDEFTDRQKGEIFARDRAICCFSGKSLWLLDFGAGPGSPTWIDHIAPAAKGGRAEISNGACASWLYNKLKRDCSGGMYLFLAGHPTADFFTFYEVVPPAVAAHLRRFSRLHWSDWYFNCAVSHTRLAASLTTEQRDNGTIGKRGPEYWAHSALKYLGKWRKAVQDELPGDFASRGIFPIEPTTDQLLLAELVSASSIEDVLSIVSRLAPFSHASWNALVDLSAAETQSEAEQLLARVMTSPYVVPRVKMAVAQNISHLFGTDEIATTKAQLTMPEQLMPIGAPSGVVGDEGHELRATSLPKGATISARRAKSRVNPNKPARPRMFRIDIGNGSTVKDVLAELKAKVRDERYHPAIRRVRNFCMTLFVEQDATGEQYKQLAKYIQMSL